MKVWITKYALTQGIYEEDVEISEISERMVTKEQGSGFVSYHGDSWHETREKAVEHALGMIQRKRNSIAKQLEKLDKLETELKGT